MTADSTQTKSPSTNPATDTGATSPTLRTTWRFDVSQVVPLAGHFEIAVDVIAPSGSASNDRPPVVLCCLPGGFLSRKYFDLEIEGHRNYSFAEAMAAEGFTTLAFDHIGVGESSKPDPIELGLSLGVEEIARANQCALEQALGQLADGDIDIGLTPQVNPMTIGVGHSMGSMLTVEQQSMARPHRGLVLFSFSTRGTPAFLDEKMRAYADDPARLRREVGELARATMGGPYPERATHSEDDRRAAFSVGTAPSEAEDALHAASTNLLAIGGLISMVPGGYGPPAEKIDVPAFMLVGDHDLHDDRHTRADLPNSPAVTTLILEDCWHCHFVANTRAALWQRTADWIHTLVEP